MYAFFRCFIVLLKIGPIGRPGLQGPPGIQGGKGTKGNQVWHLSFNFAMIVFEYNIFMTTPNLYRWKTRKQTIWEWNRKWSITLRFSKKAQTNVQIKSEEFLLRLSFELCNFRVESTRKWIYITQSWWVKLPLSVFTLTTLIVAATA